MYTQKKEEYNSNTQFQRTLKNSVSYQNILNAKKNPILDNNFKNHNERNVIIHHRKNSPPIITSQFSTIKIENSIVEASKNYPQFLNNKESSVDVRIASQRTSEIESYRIYSPNLRGNSEIISLNTVTPEEKKNPFDTMDSVIIYNEKPKEINSENKKCKKNEQNGLTKINSVNCFNIEQSFSGKVKRRSILKSGKSQKLKSKKSVKFANISLFKKLRPEEIIQTPLSEVEGLYMPTIFFFKMALPTKSNSISFRPQVISLNNNRYMKKSRRKYQSSKIISTVDYTNQRDYSTRHGGYNNLVKIKEISQRAISVASESSAFKGFSTERKLKFDKCKLNLDLDRKFETERVRERSSVRSLTQKLSCRKSKKDFDPLATEDSPNFIDHSPRELASNSKKNGKEEEIELIEHESVVFNIKTHSGKKESRRFDSEEKLKIRKKSSLLSPASSIFNKSSKLMSKKKSSFNNFLSCFDIQDSELKRTSTYKSIIKKSETLRNALNGQKVSGFEEKLKGETQVNYRHSTGTGRLDEGKLSKPVEEIISKIAKLKEEINQNKTKVPETPKYLNFMTKIIKDDEEEDFKDVNELISPIKENLKKIKIIERSKEEEEINLIETKKNETKVNTSNSQAKSSATYKTKSFEPLKRIKTMKNLNGGLNKNSISPKKIMKKLAK